MLAAAFGALLATVQKRGKDFFKMLGIEQPILQMAGDKIVQLGHWNGPALAASLALTRFDRACVIAVAPALASPQRHRAAAVGTEADAGKEGGTGGHAGRGDLRIAGLQMRLHRIEGLPVDQRWHFDGHHFTDGLQFLGLGPLVELVTANIGGPSEDAVDLAHAPAAAVAGEDTPLVEVGDDLLHPQGTARPIPFEVQPVNEPDRLGMERINLQLLLDLGPALLGGDDTVADGWQRAVPKALPGILLQGPEHMLGVLLGLVLVEQRHDLAHHHVHGIVAHLLGDGDELDSVLRQLADVELKLEVVAKETREAMDDDDVEWRGFGCSRLDHLLELRPSVIGGRRTRIDISFHKLVTARLAIGFALPLLIGN